MTPPVTAGRRVYLDNAATTWPKSAAAVETAAKFMSECGATAGRGAYRSALLADRWLEDARSNLSRLIGAHSGQSIAMCSSGTHALNAALWGLLQPGDHVITTGVDHNSLLRPLKNLEATLGIGLSIIDSDRSGFADPEQARGLLCPQTRLFAVGHASNVTGKLQPLSEWSRLAQQSGVRLLVDASQSLGYVPVDVSADAIDVLAAAGHKGLRALPGTGLLYVRPELQNDFRPLMFGGTGRASEQLSAGKDWPHCVEVGNLNLPGVVSMSVAAAELAEYAGELRDRWLPAFEALVRGLMQLAGVHVLGFEQPPFFLDRVPVVSVLVDGWDVHDLASILDTSFGIETRAGWHCAALVHRGLGSANSGGTLRLSPGVCTTLEEIDYTLAAFREILG